MIAVDASALFVLLLAEPEHEAYTDALSTNVLVMCAPSLVELHVGAWRKSGPDLRDLAHELVRDLEIETVSFDATMLAAAQSGYDRFGKGRGREPAALNFGDCFAYGLAKSRDIPLLFKGKDFAMTDVKIAASQ
ncbi:MAG: type II toxin-antitoxin system VapC family toxin [Pseudomonadota bacterium]